MNDQTRTDIEIIGGIDSPAAMERVKINGTEVEVAAIGVNGRIDGRDPEAGDGGVTVSLDLYPSSLRFVSAKRDKNPAFLVSPLTREYEDDDAFIRGTAAYLEGPVELAPVMPEQVRRLWEIAVNARLELKNLEAALNKGDASDGYHTHNELYEFRTLYHAHAVRDWTARGYRVVKSRRHHDGEPCFGGGWFIVTAYLPAGEGRDAVQVTNHYRDADWDLFDVMEVDRAPEWDGHDAATVATRLRDALAATAAPWPEASGE